MELSADPAATWTAGVGMPEWIFTANGVHAQITLKGFTFPVGALVGTQLKMPVQTAGTLQLYFGDADAANNDGAIQVASRSVLVRRTSRIVSNRTLVQNDAD